ncbi:hypothetical protein [Lacunimicrobium album]
MAMIGDLTATLGLDATQFVLGTKTAQKAIGGLLGTSNTLAVKLATGLGIRAIAGTLGGPFTLALVGATSAFTALTGAVTTAASIFAAADRQMTRISFETMIGNAKLAKQTLSELITFANETPFSNNEVLGGSPSAYGVRLHSKRGW